MNNTRRASPPSLTRWTALCAAAETVGMTAAATAAKASQALPGQRPGAAAAGLSLVVLGGLVEGTALGLAQASGLKAWLPRLNLRRGVLVTVAVAGIGWAAASAPSALSGGDVGPAPQWPIVVAGALTLGAAMGAAMGAAQAPLLNGHVSHPWRWIAANTLAWPPVMAVIFVGATAPGADWSLGAVTALGAVTGAVAGTVLGSISGWFLPSLSAGPRFRRPRWNCLRSHRRASAQSPGGWQQPSWRATLGPDPVGGGRCWQRRSGGTAGRET
jgi:hypothetical protein